MTQEICRIFCIGRNYKSHILELNNKIPNSPVIFMKPKECAVPNGVPVLFPVHGKELHYEVEVVLRIGKEGKIEKNQNPLEFIDGVTVGVDLTLRDIQEELKSKGYPWEKAKAFEQSALIGDFMRINESYNLNDIDFFLEVNGELKQKGNTSRMIFTPEGILTEINKIWNFRKNDLIFTGTPEGVGPLKIKDIVKVYAPQIGSFSWEII